MVLHNHYPILIFLNQVLLWSMVEITSQEHFFKSLCPPISMWVVIVCCVLPHPVLLAHHGSTDPLPHRGQGVLAPVGEVAVTWEQPRGVVVEWVVAAPAGRPALCLAFPQWGDVGEIIKIEVAVIVATTRWLWWGEKVTKAQYWCHDDQQISPTEIHVFLGFTLNTKSTTCQLRGQTSQGTLK